MLSALQGDSGCGIHPGKVSLEIGSWQSPELVVLCAQWASDTYITLTKTPLLLTALAYTDPSFITRHTLKQTWLSRCPDIRQTPGLLLFILWSSYDSVNTYLYLIDSQINIKHLLFFLMILQKGTLLRYWFFLSLLLVISALIFS